MHLRNFYDLDIVSYSIIRTIVMRLIFERIFCFLPYSFSDIRFEDLLLWDMQLENESYFHKLAWPPFKWCLNVFIYSSYKILMLYWILKLMPKVIFSKGHYHKLDILWFISKTPC